MNKIVSYYSVRRLMGSLKNFALSWKKVCRRPCWSISEKNQYLKGTCSINRQPNDLGQCPFAILIILVIQINYFCHMCHEKLTLSLNGDKGTKKRPNSPLKTFLTPYTRAFLNSRLFRTKCEFLYFFHVPSFITICFLSFWMSLS